MEKMKVKCNYLTSVFIELLDYKPQPIKNMIQEPNKITFYHVDSPKNLAISTL